MISLKLPPRAEKILAEIAEATGVSRDRIALDAVLERLEDWEDARIAQQRVKEGGPTVPLEEVIQEYAGIDKV